MRMSSRGILLGLLLAACGVLALTAGCGNKTPRDKTPLAGHTGNYTAIARIKYRELRAVAVILQETPSSCSVAFESPESLKDMAFTFRQDTVDLDYKGLGFQFEPDSVPEGAVAKLAVSAINRAMSDDGISVREEDGAIYLDGISERGEFTLEMDKTSGHLTKLLLPNEELEIEFGNFRFLD